MKRFTLVLILIALLSLAAIASPPDPIAFCLDNYEDRTLD